MVMRESPDPRVLVLSGYGVALSVNRGHVIAKDGDGVERRERKIARIDAKTADGLARIVILSETGYVSLDVLKWCRDLNISVIQLDRNGDALMSSPGQRGDSRIRRAQVMAYPGSVHEDTGTEIIRELTEAKLTGQRDNLSAWNVPDAVAEINRCIGRLKDCHDVDVFTPVEGNAASAYWRTWKDRVFLPVDPGEMALLPAHWLAFPGRAGIATKANGYDRSSNRNATDPINAMINYAYKVTLTEAIYACHMMGLDPSFGISHGSNNDKPGMALDLMEPLRPIADRIILGMLDSGHGIPYHPDGKPAYLSADSFYETGDGYCRVYPPVTHDIAREITMGVALEAAQYAVKIARKLALITGANNLSAEMRPVTSDIRLQRRKTMQGSTRITPLHPDLTPADMIPDNLWNILEPLLPPEPQIARKKVNPRADNRAVLAGILAHELYGAAWTQIPLGLGVHRNTCSRRLEEWKRDGSWEKILSEASKPGVSVLTS